jgi:hypothetical protein
MIRWAILVVASFVVQFAFATSAHAEKTVHLIGSTADGNLWHTIQSNGQWLHFGDVLQRTGTPWRRARIFGYRTKIEDIAIQPVAHANDLLVLIVIRYTCVVFNTGPGNPFSCVSQSQRPKTRRELGISRPAFVAAYGSSLNS